jgi:transposase
MDLHRRRSVLVRRDERGVALATVRIDNDAVTLAEAIGECGPAPEVVLEATYGWYWAADVLAEAGARVHLAHPLGVAAFAYRRVKNDERDAADLADLLRLGRLPEAWIPPPRVREQRELVRYRQKLVRLRANLKAQVHAVLAKEGVAVPMSDLFGVAGTRLLDGLELGAAYARRVASLRHLIDEINTEIAGLDTAIVADLRDDPGYQAIMKIPGVGAVLAAVLVTEIGDVHRFERPAQLASWAGLTPRHHESDRTVRRGHITKQGSRLVRWACVEAVARQRGPTAIRVAHHRIADRRGNKIGRVAAARKLLTLVYYGLRDHHIRALDTPAT